MSGIPKNLLPFAGTIPDEPKQFGPGEFLSNPSHFEGTLPPSAFSPATSLVPTQNNQQIPLLWWVLGGAGLLALLLAMVAPSSED